MAEDEDADEIPDTGAVFCFGKSNFADNQPGKFWIREDLVLQVACGDEHTALITGNLYIIIKFVYHTLLYSLEYNTYVLHLIYTGAVFCFGKSNFADNQPGKFWIREDLVLQVACGDEHTALITVIVMLKLGLKSLRATFIACGRSHTLVACDNGSVYGFGSNGEYQLGNNEEDTQYLPVRIQGLEGLSIKMLSGGADHSMALTGDGKVYTFGESEGGKLGLTETQLKKLPKPQPVTGLTGKMLSVSCGGNHTIVLTADGTAFSFGDGSSGQLGLDTDILDTSLPVQINFPYKIARVSCGENHSAFLTVNGQIYTCGNNRHGKLGLLDDDDSNDDDNDNELCNKFLPNLITRFYNFSVQQISCGGCHTAVLASKCKQLDNFQNNHTSEMINDSNTPILDARQRRRQRNLPPLFNSSVSTNDNGDSNPLNKTKLPSIGVQNSKQIIDDDEMSESDDNTEKSSKRRSLLQEAEEDESIRHVDSDLDSDLSEKSELNKLNYFFLHYKFSVFFLIEIEQIIDDDEMSESDDNTEKSSKRRSLLQEAEEDESIRHVDSDLDSDLSEKSELNKTHVLVTNEYNESQLKPIKNTSLQNVDGEKQSESMKKENENAKESKNEKEEPKEQNISTPGNEIEILSEHTIDSPKEKETSKFTSWLTLRRRQSKEIDAKEKTNKDKTKQASRLSLFRGKESTSEQNQQDSHNDQNDEPSKKRNVPEKTKSSTLSRNMQPESSDKQNHKSKACIIL
ncbi:X-linked retinitis pigmentosa GTPase regulator-like [Centruroides sculpturatus]|uniref:X-linked retinitis pigmentosa GTPase regulator-like n=1 Tax=Centruroides sculpturatus TaxID=218467 RepID=UPI000C6D08D1|nr:X-linked retinitis pigmentosa GTPase regulator-like [Centruroides sculpturatus]